MFNKLLRENKWVAGVLLLLRLYVGYQWIKAGWEKLTGPKAFDASGFMKNAAAHPVLVSHTQNLEYPTYLAFLKHFALPNAGLFNFLIPWGEFLAGLGLILGCLTTTAMFFGLMMNLMYMLAGTVSSNPWLFFLGTFILAAGANAGRFGFDYYVLPFLHKHIHFTHHPKDKDHPHAAHA